MLLFLGAMTAGCTSSGSRPPPLLIGAVFPLTGSQANSDELIGLRLAATLVNQAGGVKGSPVSILAQDAPSADVAPAAVDKLVDRGVSVLVGTYGSTQSLTASARASARGATYLEVGAVADAITGRGLPGILRTVADGSMLGRSVASFAHDVVIPGLGLDVRVARVVVMFEGDQYGSSVAYGSVDEANKLGLNVVDTIKYDPAQADFGQLADLVATDHPDVILSAAYLADAVTFRRAAIARHIGLRSIIGTSSTYSGQDFANQLGEDAVGVFAADKPDDSLNPEGLRPEGRQLLHLASSVYRGQHGGQSMTAEAVAGFVGGWILLHDLLPRAASMAQADVWRAAMSLNIPDGTEINGAGVQFAPQGRADAGQNQRATHVIWEWLGPGMRAIVYPAALARSRPDLLPITS